ncbi:DsbA family protein [Paracoccus sediminis]|nr:DsbA family protein [Paracoccus sediminis]SNR69270.1 DSBA-like thioredoxin domain-containing protein [Paracoccus sediminis]
MTKGRRNLLIGGAIVGLIYGLRAAPWDLLPGRGPRYVAIEGLSPFRRLEEGGRISTGSAAFVGLDPPDDSESERRGQIELVRSDLCGALFGPDARDGAIPVAYFSEYRCPYCRKLERDLADVVEADPGTLRVIQHEWPIFGASSELFARASVAAARQGLQQPLRKRFMQMPLVADEGSVLRVAADLGLDTDRLASDMASAEVAAELGRTRALASVFGFIGTPGLVIGRTVLNGAISQSLLRQIIADETSLPPIEC